MLRVALTGGLGSGKSTALDMFRELGCFVSQSDEVARSMMRPGQAVYRSIVHEFGQAVVRSDGTLNRPALAELAFSQDRAEALNGIVHPAVIAWQNQWMQDIGEQHPDAIAIVESALVFETRHGGPAQQGAESPVQAWRHRFDRIVLITAPEEVRVSRYADRYLARAAGSNSMERDRIENDALARMQRQLPDTDKAALSDVVIENRGSRVELQQRVVQVWRELCRAMPK